MEIKEADSPADILKCWQVLLALRSHLTESNFVTTMQEMMSGDYQLAFIEEDGKAVAAIGYRYLQYLYNGKHIYIDDLFTLLQQGVKAMPDSYWIMQQQLPKKKGMVVLHSISATWVQMPTGFI